MTPVVKGCDCEKRSQAIVKGQEDMAMWEQARLPKKESGDERRRSKE